MERQEYPFPGSWERLEKMMKEAARAGESERLVPILFEWFERFSEDDTLFVELHHSLIAEERFEELREVVNRYLAKHPHPERMGLQLAQFYMLVKQPIEAAYWLGRHIRAQEEAGEVNAEAERVLLVLRLTEFPGVIARLKRVFRGDDVTAQLEAAESVRFGVDAVIDQVLFDYLKRDDAAKVVKIPLIERACMECDDVSWSDRGQTYTFKRDELGSMIRAWTEEFAWGSGQLASDEIGAQLFKHYLFAHYPFATKQVADVAEACRLAKQSLLSGDVVDGLALEIIEADRRFTEDFLK